MVTKVLFEDEGGHASLQGEVAGGAVVIAAGDRPSSPPSPVKSFLLSYQSFGEISTSSQGKKKKIVQAINIVLCTGYL